MSYSDLENTLVELEDELNAERAVKESLENQLMELEREMEELKESKEQLEDENEDLTVKIEKYEVEIDQLTDKHESLEKDYEEAKEQVEEYENLKDRTVLTIERSHIEDCLSDILGIRSDFVPDKVVNEVANLIDESSLHEILVDMFDSSLLDELEVENMTPIYMLEVKEDKKLILYKDDKITWGTPRIPLHESYFDKIWEYKDEIEIVGKNRFAFRRELLSKI